MLPHDYRYDVAFSFLGRDEPLASELNARLRTRVRTFLYSDAERQTTLAGRDGEEMFARVFGTEAMTVVVLYRSGWGDAGFTAAEATAIRNRAYEHGYEFTTFVPLDSPSTVPPWLPRTRLWVGWERWGSEGAAAVIESRVQESGGTLVVEDSALTAASRLRLHEEARVRRFALIHSPDGLENARREFEQLLHEIEAVAASTGVPIAARDRGTLTIGAGRRRVTIAFHQGFGNTLDATRVRCVHSDGVESRLSEYYFDADDDGRLRGWRAVPAAPGGGVVILNPSPPEFLSTRRLADLTVRVMLDGVLADQRGSA